MLMKIPTDRRYAETHEWFQLEGRFVTVGITQFAADELTDITYVELPEVGASIGPDAPCGGIESVKAYSELYSAIHGTVVEINEALADNPGLVNVDAYDGGWLFKMESDDLEALNHLMNAKAYKEHIAAGH